MTVIEWITQLRLKDIDPNSTTMAEALAIVPAAADSPQPRASPARTARTRRKDPIMRGVFQLDAESAATPKAKRK